MWVMLSDSFLSIVSKDCADDELLVRARRPGDIENVFPDAVVTESVRNDYRYRAVVKREAVVAALAAEVDRIRYDNFKNSVANDDLYDAYAAVWSVMARLGARPAGTECGGRADWSGSMTAPLELDALEAAALAATPGPWWTQRVTS